MEGGRAITLSGTVLSEPTSVFASDRGASTGSDVLLKR